MIRGTMAQDRQRRRDFFLVPALPVTVITPADAQDPLAAYQKIHKIAIGGEGEWDFLEVEPAARHLYVTRGNRVVVVDRDCQNSSEREDDRIRPEVTPALSVGRDARAGPCGQTTTKARRTYEPGSFVVLVVGE